MRLRPLALLLVALLLVACTSSPLGRKQLILVPTDQMNAMGVAAFDDLKRTQPLETDRALNAYVRCVADAVLAATPEAGDPAEWEVLLFSDDTPNAFALPGRRIGVHTGLLDVAGTADQLAAVIGHEIAHVLARHGNERVSTGLVTQLGLGVLDQVLGDAEDENHGTLMALLGLGAQVGVMLPFSRSHESEADLMGLDAMARAGFDPAASVTLWENMAAVGGGQPPEFMSTHPSHGSRIAGLEGRMAEAGQLLAAARAAGHIPNCKSPRGR
jgi:predicted Zn-dependent protease